MKVSRGRRCLRRDGPRPLRGEPRRLSGSASLRLELQLPQSALEGPPHLRADEEKVGDRGERAPRRDPVGEPLGDPGQAAVLGGEDLEARLELPGGGRVLEGDPMQGARLVRRNRSDAVMVFVRAPSLEETRKRLRGRATEDEEALEARMTTALQEVAARDEFDREVVNGDREQAREDMTRTMRDIIEGGTEDDKRA